MLADARLGADSSRAFAGLVQAQSPSLPVKACLGLRANLSRKACAHPHGFVPSCVLAGEPQSAAVTGAAMDYGGVAGAATVCGSPAALCGGSLAAGGGGSSSSVPPPGIKVRAIADQHGRHTAATALLHLRHGLPRRPASASHNQAALLAAARDAALRRLLHPPGDLRLPTVLPSGATEQQLHGADAAPTAVGVAPRAW
eukprot:1268336-Prymnesium_polylepis.1